MGAVAFTQVVHDAQVHHRANAARAEDVLRFTAPDIDLVMHDVRGHTIEAPAIDADHRHVAMQTPRE
jgi:hypothetical protein